MKVENSSPTLSSERLVLRQFNEKDLESFLALYSDESLQSNLYNGEVDALEFMSKEYLNKYKEDNTYHYAVVLKDSNKVIGILDINDKNSHELNCVIHSDYQKLGYTSEACNLIIDHLKNIEYPYVTSPIKVSNDSVNNLVKKLKMKYKYTYNDGVDDIRLYQLNLSKQSICMKYWDNFPHFVESSILKER